MSAQLVTCGWLAQAWSSSKKGKRIFAKTDLAVEDVWVFEWNPQAYKTETNPGVGRFCGTVCKKKDPHGETLNVLWTDAIKDPIARSKVRLAPAPGVPFLYEDKQIEVTYYGNGKEHTGKPPYLDNGGAVVKWDGIVSKAALLESVALGEKANAVMKNDYEKGVALKRASNDKMMEAMGLLPIVMSKKKSTKKKSKKRKPETPNVDPNTEKESETEHVAPPKRTTRSVTAKRKATTRLDNDKSKKKDNKSKSKWKRSRAMQLSNDTETKLSKWFQKHMTKVGAGVYPFFLRVTMELKALMTNNNWTRAKLKDAVDTVKTQIPEDEVQTFLGKKLLKQVHAAMTDLFGDESYRFGLANADDAAGAEDLTENAPTAQWVTDKLAHPHTITFKDAVKSRNLEIAKVNYHISKGRDDGFPLIPKGVNPPGVDAEYPVKAASHKTMRFLKSEYVFKVLEDMRDLGVAPLIITDHPDMGTWSTIPTAGYTFWIRYCDAAGLSPTHELVQPLLLYVFYGAYEAKIHSKTRKKKEYPVMKGIHLALTNPRRRFASVAHAAFADLFQLLEDESYDYEALFMDRGKGTAPAAFMAAVENGTRQVAVMSTHAMGALAGRNPDAYGRVKRWRKAETYIAAVRAYYNRSHYGRYRFFLWSDWVEREDLRETYYARHAAFTDGKDHPCFGGDIKVPAAWTAKKKKVRAKKSKKKTKKMAKVSRAAIPSAAAAGSAKMVWDAAKRMLVPIISIE